MSDNPQQPNDDRSQSMPPDYSPQSGPQQPYTQHPQQGPQRQNHQQSYGSQQQPYGAQAQYGSQQAYGSQPGYSSQQAYGTPQGQPHGGYGHPGAASAHSPAAGVPIGAALPDAAYGPASVGFWNADQTERSTAMWSHLAHAATYVVGLGWIVTLILFIINKDRSPFLRHHTAQSLNLLIIGVIAGFAIGLVGGILTIVGIGFLILLLLPVLSIYMIVIEVIACMAANRGEGYRIPLTPNWIR